MCLPLGVAGGGTKKGTSKAKFVVPSAQSAGYGWDWVRKVCRSIQ